MPCLHTTCRLCRSGEPAAALLRPKQREAVLSDRKSEHDTHRRQETRVHGKSALLSNEAKKGPGVGLRKRWDPAVKQAESISAGASAQSVHIPPTVAMDRV